MLSQGFRPRTYWVVFIALVLLTLLTVGASFLPVHGWHLQIGLTFAVVKALLVVLVFMHLWHADRLSWLAAATGLFWLAILLALTLSDYLSRHIVSY